MINYNLSELAPLQDILNKRISETHNISEEDTINERVLALMVEIGELANETRCFKYWSLKESSERNIVLEEYVDGIHFLLSIGLLLKTKFIYDVKASDIDLSIQFINIFGGCASLSEDFTKDKAEALFSQYLVLGNSLGFDNTDIKDAYLLKNEKNHQRQDSGY